jgi:hypothetical protein
VDGLNPPTFIPGRDLSRRFYWEAVRPLLDAHFPDLAHAAALIGPGSEVLGFDTAMSMDHDWYPKLVLFLREQEAHMIEPVKEMLAQHLPHVFLGFPVDAQELPDEPGMAVMRLKSEGRVNHRVFPVTLRAFARKWLDWELDQPLEAADWLSFPSQTLRSLTAGAVHYDGVGELTALCQKLAWYPQDVWLYLLACGWQRIGEEEHLAPRAGFVGDELGSTLIAARLVRDIMSLCFLMERQYAPYPKWFGSAFRQLHCAGDMQPWLWQAVQAASWQEREAALCQAYEQLAQMHNALGIIAALPEKVSHFHDRPFRVIHGEVFASAICEQIHDPAVQRMVERGLIGSLDQFSDSTTLRSWIHWRKRIRRLYE